MNKKGQEFPTGFLIFCAVFLLVIVVVAMWGMPQYRVYSKELSGKAQLREAEWNRQITIQEAEAEKASAVLKAEAEVSRAIGIAEANRIISGSITPEYLKYKFIEGLNDGNTETIYVPTEANIPILEARG